MICVNVKEIITGCKHFTWGEFLWHPKWGRYVMPTPAEFSNLIDYAHRMEYVREFIKAPIIFHCVLRVWSYNSFIGGAKDSAHIYGMAGDWHAKGFEGASGCDMIREILEPKLKDFGLRMEKKPGSDWIHTDIREPGQTGRYFIP